MDCCSQLVPQVGGNGCDDSDDGRVTILGPEQFDLGELKLDIGDGELDVGDGFCFIGHGRLPRGVVMGSSPLYVQNEEVPAKSDDGEDQVPFCGVPVKGFGPSGWNGGLLPLWISSWGFRVPAQAITAMATTAQAMAAQATRAKSLILLERKLCCPKRGHVLDSEYRTSVTRLVFIYVRGA